MRWSARGIGAACAIAAYVVDQVSKGAAIAFFAQLEAGIEILPVFNLVLIRNRGVSFGLMNGLPWWALAFLGLAIVTVLSVWLWRARSRLSGAAIGLIIGGALGNIADRIRWGGVTDFLDFHIDEYHWPAFNFADVAIVSGVGLLLLQRPKPHST